MVETHFPQPFDLRNRCALVTGGSVSIGRAIALGLAAAGADVGIQFAAAAEPVARLLAYG